MIIFDYLFDVILDHYRAMMTKRLDIAPSASSTPIPQSSTSPVPTTPSTLSASFHQQRLSSSTLSPTTSLAQLSTSSPSVQASTQDPLKHKLYEILNEQRALQQRKEELERMVRMIKK